MECLHHPCCRPCVLEALAIASWYPASATTDCTDDQFSRGPSAPLFTAWGGKFMNQSLLCWLLSKEKKKGTIFRWRSRWEQQKVQKTSCGAATAPLWGSGCWCYTSRPMVVWWLIHVRAKTLRSLSHSTLYSIYLFLFHDYSDAMSSDAKNITVTKRDYYMRLFDLQRRRKSIVWMLEDSCFCFVWFRSTGALWAFDSSACFILLIVLLRNVATSLRSDDSYTLYLTILHTHKYIYTRAIVFCADA